MRKNIGLTYAGLEWVRLNLQRGQFVGVIGAGDYHDASAFVSKQVDLTHNVTEADILASQRALAMLPVIALAIQPHNVLLISSNRAAKGSGGAAAVTFLQAVECLFLLGRLCCVQQYRQWGICHYAVKVVMTGRFAVIE